jgi:hypothetical protein
MLNKLHGQPDSYDRKFVAPRPHADSSYTETTTADLDTASERHWEPAHMVSSARRTAPRARSLSKSS